VEGDFLAVGSTGTAGGVSEFTFTATAGQTIYVVAGATLDRLGSGETGTRTNGNYVVQVGEGGDPGPGPGPTGGFILVGADAGATPRVRGIDPASGQAAFEFDAFARTFRGGVRVARGDVNADGTPDIIAAAGAGGGPHVKVFDGSTFQLLPGAIGSFFAYSPVFNGGVFVAAGDVNGDGFADVITGPGAGGGPHVRVFSGVDGSVLSLYYAYSPGFLGGVSVAGGDVNGDGLADVITGAGPGGGPHVRVFSPGTGAFLSEYFAYPANFGGGVFVSAGDVNGDGMAEVITGTGPGGGPIVRVLNGLTGEAVTDFSAYPSSFSPPVFTADTRANFGVRVTALDLNGDGIPEIIATPGAGATPQGRVFEGDGDMLDSFLAFDPFFLGGVFVG
jgi:hypothetical protein